MIAPGFFSFDALRKAELSPSILRLCLEAIGFLAGDVISVTDGAGRTRHIEIKEEQNNG